MNFSKYIGLEYEHKGRGPKFDCYGLYREIFKNELNIILPDFLMVDYSHDWYKRGENHIENSLWEDWEEVYYPFNKFDALIFYYGNDKIANHIGMWIDENKILHIPGDHGTSRINRYFGVFDKRLYKAVRYKIDKKDLI